MSREVSVTGIKMTASVPEGIEVSLGYGMIQNGALTVDTTNATNATRIKAPTNNSADLTIDKDWTNSVAVSDFYQFGYLVPASSINGTQMMQMMLVVLLMLMLNSFRQMVVQMLIPAI